MDDYKWTDQRNFVRLVVGHVVFKDHPLHNLGLEMGLPVEIMDWIDEYVECKWTVLFQNTRGKRLDTFNSHDLVIGNFRFEDEATQIAFKMWTDFHGARYAVQGVHLIYIKDHYAVPELAQPPGIEPGFHDSESSVLPLDEG